MNFLGHSYVAHRVTGGLNPWLVAGSHLPDLVPFVLGLGRNLVKDHGRFARKGPGYQIQNGDPF